MLPAVGKALDVASGRGANALMLAEQGLETHAWDFSPVAIEELQRRARERDLAIQPQVRDVVAKPPEVGTFDVILVSFFLERSLVPHLIQALRPGGMIFYQTFVREMYLDRGPRRDAWRLKSNELLQLFQGMRIHYFREEGGKGRQLSDVADLAMIVVSRPEG